MDDKTISLFADVPSVSSKDKYNPRWVNYCRVKRLDYTKPVLMHNYIIWIGSMWLEWDKQTSHVGQYHTKQDHIDFDNWLDVLTEENVI